MTPLISATVALLVFTCTGFAYEYPLQFTPAPGARGLVVAGYLVTNTSVTGNCSYYTVSSGSGKGGGYHSTTTYYNQTCTWDLIGNLVSITAGAPTVPPVLYIDGTKTIYAIDGAFTAGSDSALLPDHGYVNTPGPHYTWAPFISPTGPAAQNVTLTLTSDGDSPLDITAVNETTTLARSHMVSTNCAGFLAAGSSCSITIYYDPTRLAYPRD